MQLLFPLAITLIVELLVYSFIKPFSLKLTAVVLSMNILFNTTMNLVLMTASTQNNYNITLICGEILTILLEGVGLLLILKLNPVKSFSFALLANALSLGMGLIINRTSFIQNEKALIITSAIIFVILSVYLTSLILIKVLSKHSVKNQ